MLSRLASALLLAVAGTLVGASPALAAGCSPSTTPTRGPGGGVICITATDPGAPAADSTNAKPASAASGGGSGCARRDGTPVACQVKDWGSWTSAHQCWGHPVDVPAKDPAWQGHSDGAVWMCTMITDGVAPPTLWWVPPGGAPAPLPDPGQLAQQALGQLRLETAEVHTAPQDPLASIVGVEVWMWVPPAQWRTLTKTVRAGATSVTVRATPDHAKWDMGPSVRTCFGPGREWRKGMSDESRTDCGFTYIDTSKDQPGGKFGLSAQIAYQVDWICAGACTSGSGSLGQVDAPAGTGALRVLQRQTVVTR